VKPLAALILLFAVNAFAQDFADYREYIGLCGPEQFEIETDLDYLPPDYLIAFAKKRPLKWTLSGVTAFEVREGRLDSILKDRVLSFSDGACGGLILPKDAAGYTLRDNILAVFSNTYFYLYNLNSCAMFRQVHSPAINGLYGLSSKFICKADGTGRYAAGVADGLPLYFDNITDSTGIYTDFGGCYFLRSNGEIDYFDGYMRPYSETENDLTSVKSDETGFSGFSRDIYVKISISAGGMLSNYEKTDGKCVNSFGSGEAVCGDDPFIKLAVSSDKFAAANSEYLILSEGTLSAYEKESAWQRLVYTSFASPKGCLHNGELIFSDYFLNLWKVNADASLSSLSYVPDSCDYTAVNLNGGIFYYNSASFPFASPIKQSGGRTLYKREADGVIIYRVAK
jgi:hypothetical protein